MHKRNLNQSSRHGGHWRAQPFQIQIWNTKNH